jgi:RNA polymerase sigma factor for flagellar operon FliA
MHQNSTLQPQHLALVKKIAKILRKKLPNSLDIEDLVQVGTMGLLEAQRKFDDSKGASFNTYASIRIRGCILDEIRKNTWISRSLQRKQKTVFQTVQQLEQSALGKISNQEVAETLGMSMQEYQQLSQELRGNQITSLDDVGLYDSQEIADEQASAEYNVERMRLLRAIGQLSLKERLAVMLYYQDEYTFKEVGAILGVSESRVSQMHVLALNNLQQIFTNGDKKVS